MKVFLGGVCDGSTWRDELIPMLEVDYFNPVVENDTIGSVEEEIRQRGECDLILYVITKEMAGVYDVAEAVNDSNKRSDKTILCILYDGFDHVQVSRLVAVSRMVLDNGAITCVSLEEAAGIINNAAKAFKVASHAISYSEDKSDE